MYSTYILYSNDILYICGVGGYHPMVGIGTAIGMHQATNVPKKDNTGVKIAWWRNPSLLKKWPNALPSA